MNFEGPMAALSLSEVDKYESSKKSVLAEYKVKCDSGRSFTQQEKVGIKATTFGKTHFSHRVAVFPDRATCVENRNAIETCIKSIPIGQGGAHLITEAYTKCFVVDGKPVASVNL